MGIVTERLHFKRLNLYGINIKTKFQDGNIVKERNTDNSHNDDIQNGVILNKTYFKNGSPIFAQNEYNPSVLYSLIINSDLEADINCPNCGMNGKGKDFVDGCPYCGSIYTIDYQDKNIGAKMHNDYVLRNGASHIIKALLLDYAVCLIIVGAYWGTAARTFTIFDFLKVLGLASVGALLLFYPFYILESYILSEKVKRIKEAKNKKINDFWQEMQKYNISKSKFFNNLNGELNEYFYDNNVEKNKNVIDFDIIDYEDYSYFIDDNKRVNIKVSVLVRTIELENGNAISKERKYNLTLVQNEIIEDQIHKGCYIIKCRGCGASIDVMQPSCQYCGKKLHYLQSWYIDKIE